MPRANQMQGVPAQREYLRSNDNKRRHPSYCIFAEGTGKNRICTCAQSIFYYRHCSSSSKCDYYEEK